MSKDAILKHALALSVDERIRLVDELLESVVSPGDCSELSAEQRAELLRRLEADRADPHAAVTWEEAESRIQSMRSERDAQ